MPTKAIYTVDIDTTIEKAVPRTLFITSDFELDGLDKALVRRKLKQNVESGKLRRLMPEIYHKPKYSTILNEYVVPNTREIADAIARHNGWSIAPFGAVSMNLLGMSQQIPAKVILASDGPYKKYRINNAEIEFRHTHPRYITGLSTYTKILIQCVKGTGKKRIDDRMVATLSSKFTPKDKEKICDEISSSHGWVFDAIRQICGR